MLLQFGIVAILTRYLGHLRFGDLSAGLAVVDVFEAVAEFGLTATIVMRLRDTDSPGTVLRAGAVASSMMGLAGLVVLIPVTLFVIGPAARPAVWFLLPASLVGLMSVGLGAYWQQRLSFVRLLASNVSSQICIAAGMLSLILLGRGARETIQLAAVGGIFLAGGLTAALILFPRRRAVSWRAGPTSAREVRALVVLALPLGVATSLSLFHSRVDQIVLSALGYRRGLADYAVAYQILQGVVIGANAISGVGFALMARAAGSERAARAMQTTALLCMLGVLGSFGMALLSPVAVSLLGGHHFASAVRACRLLAPVVMWSAGNITAGGILIVEQKARLLGVIAGVGLSMNAGLCFLLIPHLGVAGAATATVVTEALGTLAVVAFASASLPKSQPVPVLLTACLGSTAALLSAAWGGRAWIVPSVALGAVTMLTTGVLAWRCWRSAAHLEADAPHPPPHTPSSLPGQIAADS